VDGEWSCDGCTVIHAFDVAEMVMEGLILGRDLDEIWKEVEESL
jgi:Zn-finger protein